ALLGARVLHYRFDAVDGEGRVHRSRWYPLHVVDSLADVSSRVWPVLADEIDGPSLDAVARLGVTTGVSAVAALPNGVRSVASRRRSPDHSTARDVASAIFR